MKELLQIAALILSLVNGFYLFRQHMRDKPKLVVTPIAPKYNQIWFSYPNYNKEGKDIRAFGFLVYMSISNKGLRRVSIDKWWLSVKDIEKKTQHLIPLSIQAPQFEVRLPNGERFKKTFQVLGQRGEISSGDVFLDSGSLINGWSFFAVEFDNQGGNGLNINGGEVDASFVVTDVLGGNATTTFSLHEKSYEYASSFVKGIDIVQNQNISNNY